MIIEPSTDLSILVYLSNLCHFAFQIKWKCIWNKMIIQVWTHENVGITEDMSFPIRSPFFAALFCSCFEMYRTTDPWSWGWVENKNLSVLPSKVELKILHFLLPCCCYGSEQIRVEEICKELFNGLGDTVITLLCEERTSRDDLWFHSGEAGECECVLDAKNLERCEQAFCLSVGKLTEISLL